MTGERRMDAKRIAENFHAYFSVSLASAEWQRERLFRARYEVYCKEFGYEKEEDCPGGMERDVHDPRAIHAQVVHDSSDTLAGCVRLITPEDACDPLPMQLAWGNGLTEDTMHPQSFDRESVCEVSRLAVPGPFRRRPNEHQSPLGNIHGLAFSEEEVRTFPLISVGLFLTAIGLAQATSRPHIFAIMEPRLARLLVRSGLNFTQIGEIRDYHGRRAPYYLHHDNAMRHLRVDLRHLYDDICERLCRELIPNHHNKTLQFNGNL